MPGYRFHQAGGYPLSRMQGLSFYQFIHPADILMFQRAMTRRKLFLCYSVVKVALLVREMGEMETLPYRFLVGGGGFIWVTTVARVERGNSSEKINCVHTPIS